MTLRARSALSAAAWIAAYAGCVSPASAPGTTGTNAAAIMGGEPDTTDTGVVGVVLLLPDGVDTCSGSLVLPNLVITARHCVSQMSTTYFACQRSVDPTSGMVYEATTAAAPYAANTFYVTSDPTIAMNSNYVAVSNVIVPPNSTNVPVCGMDIALLVLATPITTATLIVPRLDEAPLAFENFTAIGYGATDGTGQTGAGERRIRSGLLVVNDGPQYATGNVEIVAPQEWLANTGTCEGDSGGPALDGLNQAMGSVSRGDANSCDDPIYTSFPAWGSFIREQAALAANALGTPPPSWITPPTVGTSQFGQACLDDAECVNSLSCLIVGNQRICTDSTCTMCPAGWSCGVAQGLSACTPDSTADGGAPDDAGAPSDGGSPPADSGTGTRPDASGGMISDAAPDTGSGTVSASHGCSTAPGAPISGGTSLAWLGIALGLATATGARRTRRA